MRRKTYDFWWDSITMISIIFLMVFLLVHGCEAEPVRAEQKDEDRFNINKWCLHENSRIISSIVKFQNGHEKYEIFCPDCGYFYIVERFGFDKHEKKSDEKYNSMRAIQFTEKAGLENSISKEMLFTNIVYDLAQQPLVTWVSVGRMTWPYIMLGVRASAEPSMTKKLDEEVFQAVYEWHLYFDQTLHIRIVSEDSLDGYLQGYRILDKRREKVPDIIEITKRMGNRSEEAGVEEMKATGRSL